MIRAENTLKQYGWRNPGVRLEQKAISESETVDDSTFGSELGQKDVDEDSPVVTATAIKKHKDRFGSTQHHWQESGPPDQPSNLFGPHNEHTHPGMKPHSHPHKTKHGTGRDPSNHWHVGYGLSPHPEPLGPPPSPKRPPQELIGEPEIEFRDKWGRARPGFMTPWNPWFGEDMPWTPRTGDNFQKDFRTNPVVEERGEQDHACPDAIGVSFRLANEARKKLAKYAQTGALPIKKDDIDIFRDDSPYHRPSSSATPRQARRPSLSQPSTSAQPKFRPRVEQFVPRKPKDFGRDRWRSTTGY